MKKWSTAEDTINCNFFLTNIKDIKITYKQNGETVLTRPKEDLIIDPVMNTIRYTWKQADWLNITSGKLIFTITVLYNDDNRIDTETLETYVELPVKDEVM